MGGRIYYPSNVKQAGNRTNAGRGEDAGKAVARRAAQSTLEDIHRILFPEGPPEPRTLEELKEGIRQQMREKYARRKL